MMQLRYGKVSVDVPAGWLAQSFDDTTMVFILYSPEELNDNFRERITISSGARMKKAEETRNVLKRSFISYYDSGELLEEGSDYIIIDGMLNGMHVQQYVKFIVKRKKAYCITATALPESYGTWRRTFMAIIDSISISN